MSHRSRSHPTRLTPRTDVLPVLIQPVGTFLLWLLWSQDRNTAHTRGSCVLLSPAQGRGKGSRQTPRISVPSGLWIRSKRRLKERRGPLPRGKWLGATAAAHITQNTQLTPLTPQIYLSVSFSFTNRKTHTADWCEPQSVYSSEKMFTNCRIFLLGPKEAWLPRIPRNIQ